MNNATEGTDRLTDEKGALKKLREGDAVVSYEGCLGEQVYIPLPFPTLSDDAVAARPAQIQHKLAEGFAEQQMAQFHKLWQNECLTALQKQPIPFELGNAQPATRSHRPLLYRAWDWLLDKWPLMWKTTHEKELAAWLEDA